MMSDIDVSLSPYESAEPMRTVAADAWAREGLNPLAATGMRLPVAGLVICRYAVRQGEF